MHLLAQSDRVLFVLSVDICLSEVTKCRANPLSNHLALIMPKRRRTPGPSGPELQITYEVLQSLQNTGQFEELEPITFFFFFVSAFVYPATAT